MRGERNLKGASIEDQGDGWSRFMHLVSTETDNDGEGQPELSRVEIPLGVDYF